MVARLPISRFVAVACLAVMPAAAPAMPLDDARPLAFEANRGQADARVRFVARGTGHTTFLTEQGATIVLPSSDRSPAGAIELRFDGGASAAPRAGAPLPGTATYIRGEDDTTRVIEAPTFARVTYADVYPGIDAVFYGTPRALEYDLVVAPGADPQSLLRKVLETGATIQRFELVQPSLHQIFLVSVGATGVEEGMSGQG